MLVVLLFLASVIAVPLLSIDTSGVPRTFFLQDNIAGRVTAEGLFGPFRFSSVPPIYELLGEAIKLDEASGMLTGKLWVSGDFGPVSFIATDSLGNVAVSPPMFFTGTTDRIASIHYALKAQCEVGILCEVAPQFKSSITPTKFEQGTGSVPAGMDFSPADGSYRGVPLSAGENKTITLIRFDKGFTANADVTILVVPKFKLDRSFLQPVCDVGFNFSSFLAWTGGPVIERNPRGPTPSLKIEILSGGLPPGVRFVQPAVPIGSYQVPQIVGSPTKTGDYPVKFKVTNYCGGEDTVDYSVRVVDTARMPSLSFVGEVGVTFSEIITEPKPAKYLVLDNAASKFLPAGLLLNSTVSGLTELEGVPSQSGNFTLEFQIQPFFLPNASSLPVPVGKPVPRRVTLTIHPKLVMKDSSIVRDVTVESLFALALNATGGAPDSVQFAISGTLPPGLTLDTRTGNISGKLPSSSSGMIFNFTIVATDSFQAKGETAVTLRSTSVPVGQGGGAPLSPGAIAGIVVGVVAAVTLAAIATVAVFKKWNASKANLQGEQSDYQLLDSKSYIY